METEVMLNTN